MQTTCPSDIQGVRMANQPTNQPSFLHTLSLALRSAQEKTPSVWWETPTHMQRNSTVAAPRAPSAVKARSGHMLAFQFFIFSFHSS